MEMIILINLSPGNIRVFFGLMPPCVINSNEHPKYTQHILVTDIFQSLSYPVFASGVTIVSQRVSLTY